MCNKRGPDSAAAPAAAADWLNGNVPSPEKQAPMAPVAQNVDKPIPKPSAIKARSRFGRYIKWDETVRIVQPHHDDLGSKGIKKAATVPLNDEPKQKEIVPKSKRVQPQIAEQLSLDQRRRGGLSHIHAITRAIDLATDLDGDRDTWEYWKDSGKRAIRDLESKRPALMEPTGEIWVYRATKPFTTDSAGDYLVPLITPQ